MQALICPVCGMPLKKETKRLYCEYGHSFDIAKENYVNLMVGSKSGELIGDSRDMAKNRRSFLNKDYYIVLAEKIAEIISQLNKTSPVILDICCGEGYYTEKLCKFIDNANVFGFDISKEMIRLAGKRKSNASFFVANMSKIPIADKSVDIAVHLFAPFHEKEFSRILKDHGYLISVQPGADHLFGLKSAIYDTPYKNKIEEVDYALLTPVKRINVKKKILLQSHEDIISLFKMTPYFYHTGNADKAKLDSLEILETDIEFIITLYSKK